MSFFDSVEKKIRKIGNTVRRVQRSDNQTKRKWVIKSSAVTVIFVVILWVAFLSSSVIKPINESPEIVQEQSQEPSFLNTFHKGLVVVGGDVGSFTSRTFLGAKNAWNSIKKSVSKSRNFSLEGEDVRDVFRTQ